MRYDFRAVLAALLAAIAAPAGAQAPISAVVGPSTSAQLRQILTDEAGTGAAVFATAATAPYSASTAYAAGNLAVGSDGNTYRAATTTTGNAPTSDCGANWLLENVQSDLSVPIPSRCANLDAAWTFGAKAKVASSAILRYQFADGTYEFPYATYTNYSLSHPFGERIEIVGNESTKANVVWNFTGSYPGAPAFLLQRSKLKKLSGFTANGPGTMAAGPGTTYLSMFLYGINGSSFQIANATINNFYSCAAAHMNSTMRISGIACTGGGDGNVWVYGGSSVYMDGTTSTGAGTHFAGAGLLVDNQSYAFAINATLQGNLNGIALFNNSSVKIDGATIGGTSTAANSNADILLTGTSGVSNVEGTPASLGSTNKVKTVAATGIIDQAIATGGYLYVDGSGNLKLRNSGNGEYQWNVGTRLVSNTNGVVDVLLENGASTSRFISGYQRTVPTTVGALTAAATVGDGTRAYVTDAAACTRLTAVTGGGSTACPVITVGGVWVAQ